MRTMKVIMPWFTIVVDPGFMVLPQVPGLQARPA
jgi:hypothetical protein